MSEAEALVDRCSSLTYTTYTDLFISLCSFHDVSVTHMTIFPPLYPSVNNLLKMGRYAIYVFIL